jgi:predicted esterase
MFTKASGLTIAVVLILAPVAGAQPERYELGHRLRSFENAWEKQTDAEARKRAIEPLLQATTAFFSGRLGEAGKSLDEGRFALESDQPPSPAKRWATAQYVTVPRRLLDVRDDKLEFQVGSFYHVNSEPPAKFEIRPRLVTADGKKVIAQVSPSRPLDESSKDVLVWKDAPVGDHRLRVEFVVDGVVLAATEQTVSLVEDLRNRLKTLKGLPHEDAYRNIEGQTFGELRRLTQSLADGKTLETDYPAARLLTEAGALPEAIRRGENYYAWPKAGQFWMRIAAGGNKETVRAFIPDNLAKDHPVPLVIALHGAGGSENMFFEGYGAGKIVRLCQERGWILVAPRLSAFAAPVKTETLIAELANRWPIDPKRVFLVGHSMGTMQAIQTGLRIPDKVAGVAALGGGQKIDAEPLINLPVFVGVGERDFLVRGVRTLHDSLTAAEVKTIVYREYPDLEHLVIVQQALPDVFAFFDGIAKRK